MVDVLDFLIHTDAAGRERYVHPTMPLDSRAAEGAMSQETIEDLQFFNFLNAAQLAGAAGALERYEKVADDPPDLRVQLSGKPVLAVELTTLSTTELSRQRLSDVRQMARAVDDRISLKPIAFGHLRGRRVSITENASDQSRPPKVLGHKFDEFIDELTAALEQDFGFAQGYPTNPDGSPRADVPADLVQRGHRVVGDYLIDVYQTGRPDAAPVT
jgi:hypothetical protein